MVFQSFQLNSLTFSYTFQEAERKLKEIIIETSKYSWRGYFHADNNFWGSWRFGFGPTLKNCSVQKSFPRHVKQTLTPPNHKKNVIFSSKAALNVIPCSPSPLTPLSNAISWWHKKKKRIARRRNHFLDMWNKHLHHLIIKKCNF